MILTQDMKEFIELLEKYQVEYVVVGGQEPQFILELHPTVSIY